MKILLTLLSPFIMLGLLMSPALTGCASIGGEKIDTLNKRIMLAESTYATVMDKVRVYVMQDRFTSAQLGNLLPKIVEIRRALQSLQAAKELKDEIRAEGYVSTIMRILITLQQYVASADSRAYLEIEGGTHHSYLSLLTEVNLVMAIAEGRSIL